MSKSAGSTWSCTNMHSGFMGISHSPKRRRGDFIFMASARVFVMGKWFPPETCRVPAVFRTLEPISTSFWHIGGKVHPPKNSLLRFLRGVKRFLINSFFIRSEMDRTLRRSGVLGCPALFQLLSASFDPFIWRPLFSCFPTPSAPHQSPFQS